MSKRTVSPFLQTILNIDKGITNRICNISDRFAITKSIKRQSKTLEYSCHGIAWLTGWLLFIWFLWDHNLFQMQINFFIGLVLDIIFTAILKAIFRRRRPIGNRGDTLSFGPDKFSFPSGHVSRAFFILYFFTELYPVYDIFVLPIIVWCLSVAYSRILLRRHHLLDVLAGVVLGFFEGVLLSYIWLSRSSAMYLISWITDEKFYGAEYDI